MAKTSQIHLRCTPEEKAEVKAILKSINKKSDFLVTYFLESFKETTPQGLKIKRQSIEKELNEKEKQQDNLTLEINNLKIELQAINENIENKSLYDLENYKHNDNILNAIDSLKRYYNRKRHLIGSINDIPKDIILDVADKNKLNAKELLEIAKNDFINW